MLIGSVIGRGGDVVRRIRAETDARVKVFEARGAARPNQAPSSLGLPWSLVTASAARPMHLAAAMEEFGCLTVLPEYFS